MDLCIWYVCMYDVRGWTGFLFVCFSPLLSSFCISVSSLSAVVLRPSFCFRVMIPSVMSFDSNRREKIMHGINLLKFGWIVSDLTKTGRLCDQATTPTAGDEIICTIVICLWVPSRYYYLEYRVTKFHSETNRGKASYASYSFSGLMPTLLRAPPTSVGKYL